MDGPNLIRTETQDGKRLRRDRFRFLAGTMIVLEVDAENKSRAAVVIRSANPQAVRPQNPPASVPLRELRIEAVAARDHRFLKIANDK